LTKRGKGGLRIPGVLYDRVFDLPVAAREGWISSWSRFLRSPPERTGFPDLCKGSYHLTAIFPAAGDPIRIQSPTKIIARKKLDQLSQRNNAFLGRRVETGPVSDMLFRPEEVHGASGIGNVFHPPPERYGYVSHETLRIGAEDFPVPDLYPDRKPAIQTGGIYLHRFPRK